MDRRPKRMRQPETELKPLKLSFFKGIEPTRPATAGIPCGRCGREDLPVAGEPDGAGRPRLLCEPCAIDDFREIEGYESREAAASARRRAADTPRLFAELVLAERVRASGTGSIAALPPDERSRLIADSMRVYFSALSKVERREIETLHRQDAVEARLAELVRFIDGDGTGAEIPRVDLSLSRDEYERLLVLAYLGNHMVNGLFKDRVSSYDDIESMLFKNARAAGLGRYAEDAGKVSVPSREFADLPEVRRFKREYDEEIFWDELIRRLADRDMRAERGAAEVSRLSSRQYAEFVKGFEAPYQEEFDTHGVSRLVVDEADPELP